MDYSTILQPTYQLIKKVDLYENKSSYIFIGLRQRNMFNAFKFKKEKLTFKLPLRELITEYPTKYKIEDLNTFLNQFKDDKMPKLILRSNGILGFAKFHAGYYCLLIGKKTKVAKIGKHRIYKSDNTTLVPLFHFNDLSMQLHEYEERQLDLFQEVETSLIFYFSYSYDLTHSIQYLFRSKMLSKINTYKPDTYDSDQECKKSRFKDTSSFDMDVYKYFPWNSRFIWNFNLMKEIYSTLQCKLWAIPLINGYITSTTFANKIYNFTILIIARRYRHFAGTRYLTRGVNKEGYSANFVETEQIIINNETLSFGIPEISSYVQIRGSIPLIWSQQADPLNPTPDIIVNNSDITLRRTKFHIGNLIKSYGHPIYFIHLGKSKSKREKAVSIPYEDAILFLISSINSSSSSENVRIYFEKFDISQAIKQKRFALDSSILIKRYLQDTNFFTTSYFRKTKIPGNIKYQCGVLRSNCIDCLDRTNMFQQNIGLHVLEIQLQEFGLITGALDYENIFAKTLIHFFNMMGDIISLQYCGSHAHKKEENNSSLGQLIWQVPDIMTSIKRHYSNVVIDPRKQEAIDLFLSGMGNESSNQSSIYSDLSFHCLKNIEGKKWWKIYLQHYLFFNFYNSYNISCQIDQLKIWRFETKSQKKYFYSTKDDSDLTNRLKKSQNFLKKTYKFKLSKPLSEINVNNYSISKFLNPDNIFLQKPKTFTGELKSIPKILKETFSDKKLTFFHELSGNRKLTENIKIKPTNDILIQIEISDKLIDGIFNKNYDQLIPTIVPDYMENKKKNYKKDEELIRDLARNEPKGNRTLDTTITTLLNGFILSNSKPKNELETRRIISCLYGKNFDYEEFQTSLQPINDKKYIQERYFE